MTEMIRSRGIQIVHVHHGRDYWPAIIAANCAGRGVRVVASRHLMTVPSRITRNSLLRFTDIIAVSKAVRNIVDLHFSGPRGRLHQIYPGIDTAAFAPRRDTEVLELRARFGGDENAVVFGLASDFGPPEGKGHLVFLRAASRIHVDFPQARFVLIGPDSDQPLLVETIRTLGLGGVARILPFTHQMPVVMNALDVLVHPAVGTEALGLVILEAMACGKPVIASRLDGIPETFKEQQHGLLVPPKDAEALAVAMQSLILNPAIRARFGEDGRQFVVSHFEQRQCARQSRELYANVLNPDCGRR